MNTFNDNELSENAPKYEFHNVSKTDNTLTQENDALSYPIPHRIFINQVDTFHGKHLSSYLADQIYGAAKRKFTSEEGMEEQDALEELNEDLATDKNKPDEEKVKYEIIGTLKNRNKQKTEDVLQIIDDSNEIIFCTEVLKCGIIIFDITRDDKEIQKAYKIFYSIERKLENVYQKGPKTYQNAPISYTFVLISTIMTWGATKPIDPEDPDTPFTETDHKKRKPHPNYKNHITLERDIKLKARKYKEKLKTIVIASGITYGDEEDELLFLFKMAWKNEKEMPVFAPGKNKIPLIHVKDLVKVIHQIIENLPKKQYILAVEQLPSTLKQIVKGLAKEMGRGRIKEVTPTEAFLLEEVDQKVFERCTVNLAMEPATIVDDLEIQWQSEESMAENIKTIVAEFKKAWGLVPLKLVVHGPPAVGKTRLAKRLAEYYSLRYINVQTVIDQTISALQEKIDTKVAKLKAAEEKQRLIEEAGDEAEEEAGEEEEEEDEEEGDIEEWQEQIQDIQNTMNEAEDKRLPDDYVIKMMKDILLSNQSQNQGFIIDGFPKTIQQAKALFGGSSEEGEEEEAAEEEEGGGQASPGKSLLPDMVISLEATDEFLCDRIMKQSESDIQGTHYTEENMIRRLDIFRTMNTEDNTVLNFFDEIEIHPIIVNAMENTSPDMEEIFDSIKKLIGDPIGFGLTPEEEEALKCLEEERLLIIQQEEQRQRKELEDVAVADYQNKMERWAELLDQYQKDEENLLIAQAEPLRHYLMRYVFPTLTRGLIQVARLKPTDPVDFLAEFLFKENPEGKMFDPSYTKTGEMLEQKYQKRNTTISQ